MIQAVVGSGAEMADFRTVENNLEEIFLEMTGEAPMKVLSLLAAEAEWSSGP